jgi:hypothetical protein
MLMTYSVSDPSIYTFACICNLTRQFDDLRAYELTSLRGFWCSDSERNNIIFRSSNDGANMDGMRVCL